MWMEDHISPEVGLQFARSVPWYGEFSDPKLLMFDVGLALCPLRPGMISGRPFVAAKFGQSWIRIKDTEKTEKTQTNT